MQKRQDYTINPTHSEMQVHLTDRVHFWKSLKPTYTAVFMLNRSLDQLYCEQGLKKGDS